MSERSMHIAILCSVVDNYGDIGFVYRLARNLSQKKKNLELTLIVSNLESFASMAPGLDCTKARQEYSGWTVLDWNNSKECTAFFVSHPLETVLQCFQCGRPDWMDEILFDKNRKDTVHIINVEYLTAEEWADDFHLLKSGTRSLYVRKINFMPGFTAKTGGLVLDEPFVTYLNDSKKALEAVPFFTKKENTFDVLLFSYPRSFVPVIKGLMDFEAAKKQENPLFKVRLLAASGISLESVREAVRITGCQMELIELPYLSQTSWDALLTLTDFNFIRGEDSFSRACLSGIPFVWHAYPQDEEFQVIKVKAIIDRMRPFFEAKDFDNIERLYISYNRRYDVSQGEEAKAVISGYRNLEPYEECSSLFTALLLSYGEIKKGFEEFAGKLLENGNLTDNLIDYLDGIR